MTLDDEARWTEFDKIDSEPVRGTWVNLNKLREYHPELFPLPLNFAQTLDPVQLQHGKTNRVEFLFVKSYENIDDRLKLEDNKINKEDLGRLLYTADTLKRKCATLKIGDKLRLDKPKSSGYWSLKRRVSKKKES